jgi:hypothetical protein
MLVGEFDLSKRNPLPDDDEPVIDRFVDQYRIADLPIDDSEKQFVLLSCAHVAEPVGGQLVELEDDSVGISIVGRKGAERYDILGADFRGLSEQDFLSRGQLFECLAITRFSLEMETDTQIRRFLSGCGKGIRKERSRHEDGEGE